MSRAEVGIDMGSGGSRSVDTIRSPQAPEPSVAATTTVGHGELMTGGIPDALAQLGAELFHAHQDNEQLAAQVATLTAWKEAVIDAGVVHWTLSRANEDHPRQAINDLVRQVTKEALDPATSPPIRDLNIRIDELTQQVQTPQAEKAEIQDELSKWLSKENENVKRGYIIAMIRDLAQAMITEKGNAVDAEYLLQQQTEALRTKIESLITRWQHNADGYSDYVDDLAAVLALVTPRDPPEEPT